VRHDGARPAIEGGPLRVERDEPLRREIADFVRAVRTRSAPLVDGEAGRRALELATRIAEKMDECSKT
jgi:predicted dehydrogenase